MVSVLLVVHLQDTLQHISLPNGKLNRFCTTGTPIDNQYRLWPKVLVRGWSPFPYQGFLLKVLRNIVEKWIALWSYLYLGDTTSVSFLLAMI